MKIKNFIINARGFLPKIILVLLVIISIAGFGQISKLTKTINSLIFEKSNLQNKLEASQVELGQLKNQDQFLINKNLTEEIKNIHDTYLKSATSYEKLLLLRDSGAKTTNLDELLAEAIKLLSDNNYVSAEAVLKKLDLQISIEKEKIASVSSSVSANVPQINIPPGSGYRRQTVKIDAGQFVVDIVSADLNSTRVVVDTASDSTCANNCPVLSLSDYVSRNGAFAGVNGSYFCPSTYPQCVDKKNSFDTLLMNKNKIYFNSDNNVYSAVPAVIFSGNSARFIQKSLDWGRDTSVDAVIANQPLLVFNNAVVFNGDGDAKHQSKGGRSFVGVTGSTVYIGVVRSATVVESAKVLYALGIHNGLNLDDGGSTALWSGGYKVGPGRNIPNAILFVKK